MEVEHFRDKATHPELRNAWSNLYLCCRECNSLKGTQYSGEELLDPCEAGEDVETFIIYAVNDQGKVPAFCGNAPDHLREKADTTARLLGKLHAGDTAENKLKTAHLRELIRDRVIDLKHHLLQVYRNQNDPLGLEKARAEIKEIVSRNAPFTMLVRSVLLPKDMTLLGDIFD